MRNSWTSRKEALPRGWRKDACLGPFFLDGLTHCRNNQPHSQEAGFQRRSKRVFLPWFERSLKIREKLAQSNAQAQRDLIFSHYKVAEPFSRSRQPSAARTEPRLAPDLLNQLRPRLPKHDADNQDQSIRALLR